MKKRNLLSGLFLAAILSLGIASTAHATDYTDTCANFPNLPGGGTFDGNGNVEINDGACTLSQAVIATGHVHITSSGAINTTSTIQGAGEVTLSGTSINVKDVVSTGNRLKVTATNGNLDTQAITANGEYIQVLAPAGKITINGLVTGTNLVAILKARDDVGLKGGVTNNGGDVRVFAHTSGSSSTPFAIGSSSGNGATFINTNGVGSGIIYISNGTSTGGITYSGSDKLQVRASGGQAGTIVLDAGANKITLTGDMNADGSSGQSSGGVLLFASEVISNGATLSANSPGHHVGSIGLTTNKVTVNSGGLTLNINGDGSFPDFVNLSITPVNSWSVTATDNPAAFITFGAFTSSSNSLSITGTGTFSINADGNGNGLKIWGNSLTLNPAMTSISQQGGWNGVSIAGWNGDVTNSTVKLGGFISIQENTTASDQGQNLVQISGTSIAALTGTDHVIVNAAGRMGGDGSIITVTPTDGSLSFGGTSGQNIYLNADGSNSGGRGGNITVGNPGGTLAITFNSEDNISASALGGNGDGGFITINANSFANGGTSGPGAISANSKGSGIGGTIKMFANDSGSLHIGQDTGKLNLSASGADGTGQGGYIEIAHVTNLSLDGTTSVAAGTGTSSNGQGGTLTVHDVEQISGTGTVNANGKGTGKAGSIFLVQSGIDLMDLTGVTLTANGACLSDECGQITISSGGPVTAKTSTISANGNNSKGGTINLISGTGDMDLENIDMQASTDLAGHGDGGVIYVSSGGKINVPNSRFAADGVGTGSGGSITISSGSDPTQGLVAKTGFLVSAHGGDFGPGGTVNIPYLKQLADVPGLFLVNTFINVSLGSSLTIPPAALDVFGGLISINGQSCQKTLTTYSWPKSYWNCVNQGNPSSTDDLVPGAANTWVPTGVRTELDTYKTTVYVFADVTGFNTFFNTNQNETVGGATEVYIGHVDITILENAVSPVNGYTPLTTTQLRENTVHEHGHALDATGGGLSDQNSFINALNADISHLDSMASCNASGTGALNGVIDKSDMTQFCSNGGTGGTLNKAAYNGKLNSQIIAMADYIFTLRGEIYAQAFAYQGYTKTLALATQTASFMTATANGLFQKGLFGCVQAIGAARAGTTYSPTYTCP